MLKTVLCFIFKIKGRSTSHAPCFTTFFVCLSDDHLDTCISDSVGGQNFLIETSGLADRYLYSQQCILLANLNRTEEEKRVMSSGKSLCKGDNFVRLLP